MGSSGGALKFEETLHYNWILVVLDMEFVGEFKKQYM